MKQHLFAAITELNGECEFTTSILVCCDKDADLNELADTIASDWRGEAEFCEQEGFTWALTGAPWPCSSCALSPTRRRK